MEIWMTLLVSLFSSAVTAPGFAQLAHDFSAWIRYPGRHTWTHLWRIMPADQQPSYASVVGWIRCGHWDPTRLWEGWVRWTDAHLLPAGDLLGAAEDTLWHKTGRHVAHAGYGRDAVRSTETPVVKAWGLNVVLLVVIWSPPWGGHPIALPINLRIHRKGGPTPVELVVVMIQEVATWLPHRRWTWVVDSGYTALAGYPLPEGHIIESRMRKNTVVYDLPPTRRRGQRGRPRVRGKRLPPLSGIAAGLSAAVWKTVTVVLGGKLQERQVATLPVIWYPHQVARRILLVFVRDPADPATVTVFFTTDLTRTGSAVVQTYVLRWPIEVTFHDVKQYLGGEDPQSWVDPAPDRNVALGFLTYTLVWAWVGQALSRDRSGHHGHLSFHEALAALRTVLWTGEYFQKGPDGAFADEILANLQHILAHAS